MFLSPTPELPDDTPIDHVRFATRIRNVLNAAGDKTVGEVRKTSDKRLLSFKARGQRGADIRPDFQPAKMCTGG